MSETPSRGVWLELLSVTGLLFSYIWLWEGKFAGDFVVCLGLVLAITLAGHRRRGESARDLGFRLDNATQSAREVFSIVAPLLVVIKGKVMPKAVFCFIRRIRSIPATILPHWSLPPICSRQSLS